MKFIFAALLTVTVTCAERLRPITSNEHGLRKMKKGKGNKATYEPGNFSWGTTIRE